jgi:hypothetical protein
MHVLFKMTEEIKGIRITRMIAVERGDRLIFSTLTWAQGKSQPCAGYRRSGRNLACTRFCKRFTGCKLGRMRGKAMTMLRIASTHLEAVSPS